MALVDDIIQAEGSLYVVSSLTGSDLTQQENMKQIECPDTIKSKVKRKPKRTSYVIPTDLNRSREKNQFNLPNINTKLRLKHLGVVPTDPVEYVKT